MTITERIRRRFVASFNWDRIGFRSRWICAVFYLKRETYEIWFFGRCWTNHQQSPVEGIDNFNTAPVRPPLDPAMDPGMYFGYGGVYETEEKMLLLHAMLRKDASRFLQWQQWQLWWISFRVGASIKSIIANRETYQRELADYRNYSAAVSSKQSSQRFIPYDPEMQPFDMTMAGGFVVSFSMKTTLKVGEQIHFWGKPYIVSGREEKDGFIRYSLAPDSIPEVKYRGSTADGEQFKISPPTKTMIEDAGPPSTYIKDRLAEMLASLRSCRQAPDEPEPRKNTCGNCGREVRGLRNAPEIPIHVDTESRACETSKRRDTFAEYASPNSLFPPEISIRGRGSTEMRFCLILIGILLIEISVEAGDTHPAKSIITMILAAVAFRLSLAYFCIRKDVQSK